MKQFLDFGKIIAHIGMHFCLLEVVHYKFLSCDYRTFLDLRAGYVRF